MKFESKEFTQNKKTKLIMTWLHDALISNSLHNSAQFSALTNEIEVGSVVYFCELFVRDASVSEELYSDYRDQLCNAFIESGYKPSHVVNDVLMNHFAVVLDILLRLVALMFSINEDRNKWLMVYQHFTYDLIKSHILYIGFFHTQMSAMHKLINDELLNNKLKDKVADINALYTSAANLTASEKNEVAKRKHKMVVSSLLALSVLGRQAPLTSVIDSDQCDHIIRSI